MRFYHTLKTRCQTMLTFAAAGVLNLNNRITQLRLPNSNSGENQINTVANSLWVKFSDIAFLGISLLAIIIIVNAGIRYITAGSDPGKAKTARTQIMHALLALLLVMGSYIILRIIVQIANFLAAGVA